MLKAAVLSKEATEEALARARELEEKDRKERKKDKKKLRKVPLVRVNVLFPLRVSTSW